MLNKRWALSILGVMVLLFATLLGCLEDSNSGGNAVAPIVTATDQQQNSRLTTVEAKNTEQDTKISELTGKIAAIPPQTGASQSSLDSANSKISDLQTKVNDLQSKFSTLETKVSQWTNPIPGQTPLPPPGTPTGQVSYTVTSGNTNIPFAGTSPPVMTVRVYNGTSVSRYVKIMLTLNTYNYQQVKMSSAPTVQIQSTAVGGAPGFTFNISPTIGTAASSFLFIATGGGTSGYGEIILGPGTSTDMYVMLGAISSTDLSTPPIPNVVMWTFNVSGADRPLQ